MNRRKRVQLSLEFVIDLICLILASAVSIVLFRYVINRIPKFPYEEWARYWGTLILAYLVVFFGYYVNIDVQKRSRGREFYSVFQNAALTFGFFSVLIVLLKNPIVESRYMLISSFLFFIVFTAIARYFLKRYLTGYFKHGKTASLVGVITTTDRAEELISKIKQDWTMNISGVVLLDDFCKNDIFSYRGNNTDYKYMGGIAAPVTVEKPSDFPDSILDVPVISTDETFIDWMLASPLDEVFVNLPYGDDSELQVLIEELEDMGITVHINLPALDDILSESKFNNINCKMQYGYPMASFAANEKKIGPLAIKRVFDIVLGLIGCIVSLPVIAITAIPLLKESPGPLIFKQARVGKNGRIFNIYKLRSMYVDAEERKKELLEQNQMDGFMFKMEDDPRITKVGRFIRKTSIDELPQFFNVVKGDMSLVGTRPPTVDEFEQYESRHKRRLSMRPGITGMWQVSGRSEITDFEDVVELDCQYIDEWTLGLDAKILIKTVGVVLTHKGAE